MRGILLSGFAAALAALALAALALPGGRAAAQSVTCTNDAGEAAICAVPVIEQPADADDYFLLKVVDQATGDLLNRGQFGQLLELKLTVPAGAALHSHQNASISRAPRCEDDGTALCLLLALSSALVAAELACSDAAIRLDCAFAVKMGAAAADPLAPGAYIVRVVAGGFAAEDRFFVAGRAARIEIAPGGNRRCLRPRRPRL